MPTSTSMWSIIRLRDMQIVFPDSGDLFQHDFPPCHYAKNVQSVTKNEIIAFRMAREFARLEPHRKFMGYN